MRRIKPSWRGQKNSRKADAERPGAGVRVPEVGQQRLVATVGGIHGDGEAAIEIRPCLKQSLGMAAADAIILTRQRIEIVHTALEDAHGFALDFVA